MSNNSIPIAIVGATGYAGEGSLRILLGHPNFHIVHAGSDRLAGTPIGEAVPALAGECPDLVLAADNPKTIIASGAQAVVLAKKSPEVTAIVPTLLKSGVKIVDIGAEFRLRSHDAYKRYYGDDHQCPEMLSQAVYGLSELNADAIRGADLVGNPGCYPTSILLPLIPLLKAGLLDLNQSLCSISYSGASGAGKRYLEKNNNLFYALNENMHSYKALQHQHTGEIDQELSLAAGEDVHLHFVPHLMPITRGIHSTITCSLNSGRQLGDVFQAWRERFSDSHFVRIHDEPQQVEVANTTGTNYIDISATADGQTLILFSAEDNLVKGAAGQAVQNLNLMYGFDEHCGLTARGI